MVTIILTGLNSLASSGLYLTENKVIDRIKDDSASTYKIYGYFLDNPEKYDDRIVQKSEISLATTKTSDGHKVGAWALAKNAATGLIEHCIINNAFENSTLIIFCDIIQNKKQIRHYFLGASENYVPETSGESTNFKIGEHVTLKKATATIELGEKVFIRAFFANGTALVQLSGLYAHILKGPFENAMSSVVELSDLEKRN